MGRKEGAAAGAPPPAPPPPHEAEEGGGDFEHQEEEEDEEGGGEELPPARARATRRGRIFFFFAGGGWELRGACAGGESGWGGVGVERWWRRRRFAEFWAGEPLAEGQLVPLVRMGSGGEKRARRRRRRHKRGRRTRRGVRLCASEGVGRERLVPLVCMWIPLALSLSLCGVHRVCIFVNIASKLVASFDLRRVRTSPHGRGAEGRRDSGAG